MLRQRSSAKLALKLAFERAIRGEPGKWQDGSDRNESARVAQLGTGQQSTGFPIAKIAARLAVGMSLDEIPNDITKKTPACFEPTIDYVVVKFPSGNSKSFPARTALSGRK